MNEIKILIVEDDIAICKEFRRLISEISEFKITSVVNNSHDALESISAYPPDVIILDLELNYGSGNGFEVLKGVKKLSSKPFIVVTTNILSELTYQMARDLGTDFIFYKHQKNYSEKDVVKFIFNLKDLFRNISNKPQTDASVFANDLYEEDINIKIVEELRILGMPCNFKGYEYIKEGIRLVINHQTNNIFKNIGKKYNQPPINVERAMQNAIDKTWRITPNTHIEKFYTASYSQERGAPTVTQFLFFYADKVAN